MARMDAETYDWWQEYRDAEDERNILAPTPRIVVDVLEERLSGAEQIIHALLRCIVKLEERVNVLEDGE